MNDDRDGFEILPAEEMQAKYCLYSENAPRISLDPTKVPEPCRLLIPLAEVWGINDDLTRADLLRKAPKEAIRELKNAIRGFEDALDEWLAGPDASSPDPSAEYLAFTCMRMAADEVVLSDDEAQR